MNTLLKILTKIFVIKLCKTCKESGKVVRNKN